MLPGSTSKELVAGVLRGQLGFQGLVVTDATPMVGFSMALSRANALVAALNAGVDMLLSVRTWKRILDLFGKHCRMADCLGNG